MTETARVYGGSLYELAQEEHLEEEILSEMKEIRALFRENPEYPRLLSEPSIPRKERIGLIDAAFGSQMCIRDRYAEAKYDSASGMYSIRWEFSDKEMCIRDRKMLHGAATGLRSGYW